MKRKFGSRQTTGLPHSFPASQSIFLPLSLTSLLLHPTPHLVNVSFGFFSAFPSLILQRGIHDSGQLSLSKSPTEEDSGEQRERVRRSGRNGGRLCLREGETETEVTSLPKNPAEMENVTVSEKKKEAKWEKGRPEKDLLQEAHEYTGLMDPKAGDGWNVA